MRRTGNLLAIVVMLMGAGGAGAAPAVAGHEVAPVRNVIFMLADGTGPEAWPLARWVKGAPLAVDGILTGAVRTYGADSIITDSAPGATAYATGYKGTDKAISVGPWHVTIDAAGADATKAYVPLATVLEGARLSGRATGLVATSNVQHATPAAFSAHWPDRGDYLEIAEQQVYEGIDVVLGGGAGYLLPEGVDGGRRRGGENLVDVLKSRGYSYVTTAKEMSDVHSGKVWGAFAPAGMAYDLDRARFAPTEPSLAEMTGKAIELLSGSPKTGKTGFFLFVEGSEVDWAAHDNDPAGLVSDLLAFDRAVGVALDFAMRDGRTLLVVVADHGTGGVSIGTAEDHAYSTTDDDAVVGPLRRARVSAEGLEKLLRGCPSAAQVEATMADAWGIEDLAPDESSALRDLACSGRSTIRAAGKLLSRRARIGWTTGGHTGADVFLFAYGPGRPAGLVENTEIAADMAAAMGFDLGVLECRLFVDAAAALEPAGYTVTVDRSRPDGPVLVVRKGEEEARLPISSDLLGLRGQTVALEGIVVAADDIGKVFVPRQAVDAIREELR